MSQNRRVFIQHAAAGVAGFASSSIFAACMQPEPVPSVQPVTSRMFIGTYTRGDSEGIYRGVFNHETGALTDIQLAAETINPSFLTVHPDGNKVLAVNEVTDFDGTTSGAVSSFAIGEEGALTLTSQQRTEGGAPCYISTDAGGKWALIANYGGGNVSSFPVQPDGTLGPASSVVQHEGSSINERRQEAPHAHCIVPDPGGSYAFAADLGIDKVMIYQLDPSTGVLTPNTPPFAAVTPGAGPRHFAFHPDGRHAFLINELNSTITAFAYDPSSGTLSSLGTASTLPEGFSGSNTCADIHVHPNGQFVYGSNRGHDSIAIMAFDSETGKLSLLGTESTQGSTPRNFTLDLSGAFLLAANQQSDTVVSFHVDPASGLLEPTGFVAEVPTPVCLKFA